MILKKGAQVKVISGKDKGKTGEILEINRKLEIVKVKAINIYDEASEEGKNDLIDMDSKFGNT